MDSLTPEQATRLNELLRYLDRWRAAHASYFGWIAQQWARRLARFAALRSKARQQLLAAGIDNLKTDKSGRVLPASARGNTGNRKRFATRRDKILVAVVEGGEEIFGVRGSRDRAGIYHGEMAPDLRRAAVQQLRKALK